MYIDASPPMIYNLPKWGNMWTFNIAHAINIFSCLLFLKCVDDLHVKCFKRFYDLCNLKWCKPKKKEKNIWKWACIEIVDDRLREIFFRMFRSKWWIIWKGNTIKCQWGQLNWIQSQNWTKIFTFCLKSVKNTTNPIHCAFITISIWFFRKKKNKITTTQKTIDDHYSFTIAVTQYFRSDKMIKMQIFSR